MWKRVRNFRTLKGHTAGVESVAFSSDSKLIASGGADQTVRVWAVDSEKDALWP